MIKEVYFLDFFNRLTDGDKKGCIQIVDDLISQDISIPEIYTDLFQKSLYRLGKFWEENKISIAEEHMCTQIVRSLMCKFSINSNERTGSKKSALISCIEKEFHEIGARMAADVFELNGWEVIHLGASTPTRELIKIILVKKPDIVGLSFNFYLNVHRLIDVIEQVKKKFPEQKIIVGGQGIEGSSEMLVSKFKDIVILKSVNELDIYLKNEKSIS